MTTLKSTSILASIIAQNPFHIVSLQGQLPMSHAQNTYDFEIAEDDPHYEEISDFSLEVLWVYTYADKESLELDLMEILNQMDLLRGEYFDYNVDELDMVLYGATLILEQEKYKPLILAQLQHYQDCFFEQEHAEIIDYYYYIDLLEEPETLYENAEQTINFLKTLIK